MIARIPEMPPGAIGLRAAGKLSKDDYRDFLEPDAWIEDVKTGLGALVRDHSAWKRFALVTDVEWVAKAFRLFTWMTPGEVRIFELDGLEEAKGWVAGGG
jgi:hypothetical protein